METVQREMTEAELWAAIAEEDNKYHQECNRVNDRILKALRKIKGQRFVKDLLDLIQECEVNGRFEIVSKPKGKMQSEEFGKITRIWVDHRSVGYEGDVLTGEIYIKVKPHKWIKLHYDCY